MRKYIDADKLIAEIERLKREARKNALIARENNNTSVCVLWSGKEKTCTDILDIITSFQPEGDLEKEIDELWKSLNTGHEYVIVRSYQDFLGICLHCFELGLNTRKEEES